MALQMRNTHHVWLECLEVLSAALSLNFHLQVSGKGVCTNQSLSLDHSVPNNSSCLFMCHCAAGMCLGEDHEDDQKV